MISRDANRHGPSCYFANPCKHPCLKSRFKWDGLQILLAEWTKPVIPS